MFYFKYLQFLPLLQQLTIVSLLLQNTVLENLFTVNNEGSSFGWIGIVLCSSSPQQHQFLPSSRSDGVVVRAFASQSVDLGFILLVESYQKTLKNGIHSFRAWRSAFMGGCGEQARKFACCARHLTGRPTFMWKTGGPDTSEIAPPKRVQTYRPKYSDTIRFLVNGG